MLPLNSTPLGFEKYDIRNLDLIDKTAKKIINENLNKYDKKFLLSKYFESKKSKLQFKNYYALAKKEKENEEKRIKEWQENPEYLYEEEEEQEDEEGFGEEEF